MRLAAVTVTLLLAAALLCGRALAHERDRQTRQSPPAPQAGAPAQSKQIGIDEKLGRYIRLDLPFKDESGKSVTLRGVAGGKPMVLTMVYYKCKGLCSPLLDGMGDVLARLPAQPGVDYEAVAVSIDPTETPADAVASKAEHFAGMPASFPKDAWHFLTGSQASITALTGATGYIYQKTSTGFLHPIALVVVAPDGKITRYLYGGGAADSLVGRYMNGAEFLPMDLKLAVVEASHGRVGPTISKVLQLCFSYDPKGNKLVFNTLKVTGFVTLSFVALFVGFLALGGRKRDPTEDDKQ